MKLPSRIVPLLILITILGFARCQQITQHTIYLQKNERYLLNLGDYYDFTAGFFDFPSLLSPQQIQNPLVYFNDKFEGREFEALCSFQDTEDSKYLLGFGFHMEQIIVIYSNLQLISGIPKRTELANLVIGSTKQNERIIKACFYNSVSGFIISNINQKLLQFTYVNQELVTRELPHLPLDEFVAVQFNENIVYLLCANRSTASVSLLSYNIGLNKLILVDQFKMLSKHIQIQVDFANSGTMVIQDQKNHFYIFSVNFQTQKLIASQFSGIKNGNLNSIQSFKDYFFVTFRYISSTSFYKLRWNKFGNEGGLEIFKTGYINQSIKKSILIDDDILIFDNLNKMPFMYTFVYNIQKNQQIYQFDGMISDVYKFIKNVIIKVNLDDKPSVQIFTPFRVQNPSIMLIGDSNQVLDLTVYQYQKQYFKKITINVNVSGSSHVQIKNNLISIQLKQNKNSKNYVQIDGYFEGSYLLAESDFQEKKMFASIALTQTSVMSENEQLSISNIQAQYKTDGLFSSIIVEKENESQYKIYAMTPFANQTANFGKVLTYEAQQKFNSPIEKIDNQGVFTLKDSSGIYFPVQKGQTLTFQKITTKCTDFQFASDLSNGVIFIKCDKEITQYNFEIRQSTVNFVKQSVLNFDASDYQQLICIRSYLYIKNDQSIAVYNYLLNSFAQNLIEIPQLSTDNSQEIILFSSTFFIVVQNAEQKLVAQYSYLDFNSNKPCFLRSLATIPVNSFSFIPIREEVEYLILKTDNNLFYLYKVNNVFSQNQFYSMLDLNEGNHYSIKAIFNSKAFCLISPITKCSVIFKENSLEYSLYHNEQVYENSLILQSQLQFKFKNQEELNVNFQIIRDASTKNGFVDQNSDQIQKLRTQIQDEKIENGTTLFFDDQQIINSCILGWKLLDSSYATILNRIQSKINQIDYNAFTLFYGLKVILMKDKLIYGNNLLVLEKNFSDYEVVLYDSASYKQIEATSFSVNVYIIGQEYMQIQNAQLNLGSDGSINKIQILDCQIFQYSIDNFSLYPLNRNKLQDYSKIITIDEQIWMINSETNNAYQIKMKKNLKMLKMSTNYPPSQINVISYNVINQLKLQLTFYCDGIINVVNFSNSNNIKYYYKNLKDLLSYFKVEQTDKILSIIQYSDNKFWIKFADSYIFDVTFSLDKSSDLILSSAGAYYYRDSFQLLKAGFKGKKHTLLISDSFDMTVALYSIESYQNTSYYLIQSHLKISEIDPKIYSVQVSHIEEETEDKIIVYCLNKKQIVLQIRDNIGINFPQGRPKHDFQLKITPLESNNIENVILLNVNSEDKSYSHIMNNFNILITLILLIIIF
ncbi:hypothetical protein TTHERM_00245420 (macronuclear) [Tetrahymena thermophila SB210]|uniref:Transmembrane protein n=1 Tax=Tetrahymena thermophila (strain SB210) TaxID=312017 RepID=Q245V7_TETTS|nr:hypothetical protein TTHERM_00245420 [Tetrahymena thermophila SB210]EAS03526.2 hypothetical protein TTHERM_00245420 [Tetrahymena thermophila SB210]|eukprot:XP_001023771.2 hypothetical protein TTHERM_00245420 [Tetrahymena thermophila SB210]